jgi:hypothetical protein
MEMTEKCTFANPLRWPPKAFTMQPSATLVIQGRTASRHLAALAALSFLTLKSLKNAADMCIYIAQYNRMQLIDVDLPCHAALGEYSVPDMDGSCNSKAGRRTVKFGRSYLQVWNDQTKHIIVNQKLSKYSALKSARWRYMAFLTWYFHFHLVIH